MDRLAANARVITLQSLRRELTFVGYDRLELRFLQPLRNEVDLEIAELTGGQHRERRSDDA